MLSRSYPTRLIFWHVYLRIETSEVGGEDSFFVDLHALWGGVASAEGRLLDCVEKGGP